MRAWPARSAPSRNVMPVPVTRRMSFVPPCRRLGRYSSVAMAATSAVFRPMPKTEVHLHLEGTTSPETLWALAGRNHVALPAGSLEELRALYVFDGFDRFVELWLAMCRCLRTPTDYEQMVDAYVAE